jgi:hypothetical protein
MCLETEAARGDWKTRYHMTRQRHPSMTLPRAELASKESSAHITDYSP